MNRKERVQEIVFATVMALLASGMFLVGIRKWEDDAKEKEARDASVLCINPLCDCGERCFCDGCECNLDALQKELNRNEPNNEQKVAPVRVARIVMHTIPSCVACEQDKAKLCIWVEKGWRVEIVDDGQGIPGKLYPWYEVEDADGVDFSFVGRLIPESFSANKRKAVNDVSGTNR
jgi:hypothetical protein